MTIAIGTVVKPRGYYFPPRFGQTSTINGLFQNLVTRIRRFAGPRMASPLPAQATRLALDGYFDGDSNVNSGPRCAYGKIPQWGIVQLAYNGGAPFALTRPLWDAANKVWTTEAPSEVCYTILMRDVDAGGYTTITYPESHLTTFAQAQVMIAEALAAGTEVPAAVADAQTRCVVRYADLDALPEDVAALKRAVEIAG